jgi:hypothetical protein
MYCCCHKKIVLICILGVVFLLCSCRWTPRCRLWDESQSLDFCVVVDHVSVVLLWQETSGLPPLPYCFPDGRTPSRHSSSAAALCPLLCSARVLCCCRRPVLHAASCMASFYSPFHPRFPSHRVSGASHPAPAATTPKIARCLHSYPHSSPATPLLRLPSACSFSLAQRQRWPSDWNSGQTIGGVRCGEGPCLCPAALSLFCSPTTSKILLKLVSSINEYYRGIRSLNLC